VVLLVRQRVDVRKVHVHRADADNVVDDGALPRETKRPCMPQLVQTIGGND
jgi:hypothetical protein